MSQLQSLRVQFDKLFRPNTIRQQLASSIERQNAENCLIYRLPPEILLDMADLLETMDFLALSYTSRWFNALLQKPNPLRCSTAVDRYVIRNRLKKDDFAVLVAAEIWTPWKKTLLCQACQSSHDNSFFTAEQRQVRSGLERKCMGSYGKVQICAHYRLNRVELRGNFFPFSRTYMCEVPAPEEQGGYLCGRADYVSQVFSKTFIQGKLRKGGEPLCWSTVATRLKEANQYICPHMHSADKTLLQQLRKNWKAQPRSMGPYSRGDPKSDFFAV